MRFWDASAVVPLIVDEADGSSGTLPFVCLDERLAVAAEREGFPVVDRIS